MKIIHVAKNDLLGGASRSAYRLHQGLVRLGADSSMLVADRSSDDPCVKPLALPAGLLPRLWRRWRRMVIGRGFERYRATRPAGYELFSDARSHFASAFTRPWPACDVIHLHWAAGFLDYETFFANVPPRVRVVWTLHDMNPFTGGCHYGLGCDRFVEQCGACPQLGSVSGRDLSWRNWQRKRRAYAGLGEAGLQIVTPSRWLARETRRSALLGRFPVTVIPYGLDVGEFAPRSREAVRKLLGIPREGRVVLFVAEGMDNRRKGFSFLVDALNQCAGRVQDLMLLSLGQNKPHVQLRIPWQHVGSVNHDRFLSMVYSAADVFVICSQQDNLPNTVLEAVSCGLPVVGVEVGGIPDMVRHGFNGFTVPAGDPRAMAEALVVLLNDLAKCAGMGQASRDLALTEYTLEHQARNYLELYSSLSQGRMPGAPKAGAAAA